MGKEVFVEGVCGVWRGMNLGVRRGVMNEVDRVVGEEGVGDVGGSGF